MRLGPRASRGCYRGCLSGSRRSGRRPARRHLGRRGRAQLRRQQVAQCRARRGHLHLACGSASTGQDLLLSRQPCLPAQRIAGCHPRAAISPVGAAQPAPRSKRGLVSPRISWRALPEVVQEPCGTLRAGLLQAGLSIRLGRCGRFTRSVSGSRSSGGYFDCCRISRLFASGPASLPACRTIDRSGPRCRRRASFCIIRCFCKRTKSFSNWPGRCARFANLPSEERQ